MKQIDDYETSLQFWADQADRCHTRLCELADNDRTKWTPQYWRMLDTHAEREAKRNQEQARIDKAEIVGKLKRSQLDLMFANAYPESWVRDVMLGNQP